MNEINPMNDVNDLEVRIFEYSGIYHVCVIESCEDGRIVCKMCTNSYYFRSGGKAIEKYLELKEEIKNRKKYVRPISIETITEL